MEPVRKELLAYVTAGSAHVSIMNVAKDISERAMNDKIPKTPFTPWALLEHIRITQKDMVDFMASPDYGPLEWPKDYWPAADKKATKTMWNKTLMGYKKDLETLKKIIKDPKKDLFAPIPRGNGQTIMKEILQIIDHTAYHTGELVLMRRALGAWRE
jgi:hypothetical protein